MTDYTPRQWQPKEKISDTLPAAAKQWQPKRKQNVEGKKFYTFRGGKVENYKFSDITDLKRSKSEEILTRKGKIFQIRKPDTMIDKIKNPQTKLWYYDKRNYPNRKSMSDLTDKKPRLQMYSIKKPDPNKKRVESPVHEIQDEILVEEKKEPTPYKEPEPEPEPVPEPKKEEPKVEEPPKQKDSKSLARAGVAAAVILPPIVIPKSSVSHYTVNSIEKSLKYYRF